MDLDDEAIVEERISRIKSLLSPGDRQRLIGYARSEGAKRPESLLEVAIGNMAKTDLTNRTDLTDSRSEELNGTMVFMALQEAIRDLTRHQTNEEARRR